jgi:hypothetical protein
MRNPRGLLVLASTAVAGCGAARAIEDRIVPWTTTVITGRVLDSTRFGGISASGVTVSSGPASATADHDGRFVIEVPRNTRRVVIRRPADWALPVPDLDTTQRHINIDLVLRSEPQPVDTAPPRVATLPDGRRVTMRSIRISRPLYVIRIARDSIRILSGSLLDSLEAPPARIARSDTLRGTAATDRYGSMGAVGAVEVTFKKR